jgi:hypothetical protein
LQLHNPIHLLDDHPLLLFHHRLQLTDTPEQLQKCSLTLWTAGVGRDRPSLIRLICVHLPLIV